MKTPDTVTLHVNGRPLSVKKGTSVAAALRIADAPRIGMGMARRSVQGEARAPFCGMGICQECRVDIDGRRRLACQTHCEDGMVVEAAT
jgi:D-hydroxyproline dehydrogenase subunit gamma